MPESNSPLNESPREADAHSAPVLPGHTYDGIKEYDNPMPRWWVVLFWVTILWSIAYVPGVHFWDWIDTYGDDLAEQDAALAARRAAYESANPTFAPDPETLAGFVGNAGAIEAGAVKYAAVCAACHGAQGEGLIGPNLADAYWIHGGSDVDIFNVLTHGVLEKGMPAWEAALSGEERAQVLAFIRSLEGTNLPGAKEPQGELYEE